MPLVLSGSVNISGSMTATTILVSSPGAAGMVSSSAQITELAPLMAYTASLKSVAIVSSSQQVQNYFTFARTGSANTFFGNQGISGSLNVSGSLIVGGTDVTHYIGESYGGGIVFYVYDGGKHGLISATLDQSTGTTWYNGGYAAANAPFDGINAGIRNTTSITTVYQTGSYAAEICAFFNGGNFGDWYLPSKYELNLLYQQKTIVGGFANETYWSSTELHPNNARASTQTFTNGVQNNHDKSSTFYVRAIRAF